MQIIGWDLSSTICRPYAVCHTTLFLRTERVCPWRNEALTHLMPFICQSQPSALHPSFCGVASRAAVCSQRSSRRLDSVHSKYLDRLKCLWFISDLSSVRSACCVRLCREHTYTSPENWDTAARDTAAGPDTRQYLTHKQTRTTWWYNSVSLESLIYCYKFCRYCELDFIFAFSVFG